MSIISTINWKRLALVFVPGVLIAAISIYVLGFRALPSPDLRVLSGKALAACDGFYPIHADDTGALYLDRRLFVKVVNHFSQHPLPCTAADLIYLGNSNSVTLLLDEPTKTKYLMLAQQPDYVMLSEMDREKDRIFQSYADIVDGIGQAFVGTSIEIVLHDTRNPPHSIVAVRNLISDRRLDDMNTNFGIQLIKNYSYGEGQGRGRGVSFVSYGLTLKDGRAMKSTTIPIFHDVYGLIGPICINIDISKVDEKHSEYIEHFVDTFKTTIANDVINEMIQDSKRKN